MKHLDFSHNQINDENFESFQLYPKENLILEELDLSSNYITDKGAIKFFKNLIDNRTLLKMNFFDNHLENETANVILDMLKSNRSILNINVNCNNISLKYMDEIKNQIQNNKIIEKVKYIPKLKNELRDLEFDPNEINDIKNKLKYYNMERENLTQKFRKEVKELQNKKKDNLKSYKNIEETIKKIEKQNNNLQNQFSNLKEEDINEGNTFIENLNKINLKHKYNEEVELFKITYNKTKKEGETLKIGLTSLQNQLNIAEDQYKKKLDYLEKLKSAVIKKNDLIKYSKRKSQTFV